MRPRPVPSFAVDTAAAVGAGAAAFTLGASISMSAHRSGLFSYALGIALALAIGIVVRHASRRAPNPVVTLTIIVSITLAALVFAASGDSRLATFSSLPTLALAIACVILVSVTRSARAHGSLDSFERVASASGQVAAVAGAIAYRTSGIVMGLVLGIGLLAIASVRDIVRARWLARVRAGRVRGWSIVREEDLDTREAVPHATDHAVTDSVLAYEGSINDPYRSARAQVVARVDSKPLRVPRLRAASSLAMSAFAIVIAFSSTHAPAVAKPALASTLEIPSCVDARAYFRERLMENPHVAWATLLTHDQDPTIAEGEGVLLVLPRGETNPDAEALAIAQAIPCAHKLALHVERPKKHAFVVSARLELDNNADRDSVRREARKQMQELLDVTENAALVEHVHVGAEDKTFGWRPRYVLRHVPGVRSAKVLIDGTSGDVPIGPRELPEISELQLIDQKTGASL